LASRFHITLIVAILVALLAGVQGASAQTYTITVSTDVKSYVSGQQIKVSGTVSPAPGPSTAVGVRIFGPGGSHPLVAVGDAPVGSTTGDYNYTFVAGGSSQWTTGTYTVNATWGAYPPAIFHTTTFNYTASTTTTTSTTSTTTSTTSTTSATSTTSTSTTHSTTTNSTTTTTSAPTTTSSTSTVTTSSSSTAAVPEFPYQSVFVGVFVLVIAAAYLMVRKLRPAGPVVPPMRRD